MQGKNVRKNSSLTALVSEAPSPQRGGGYGRKRPRSPLGGLGPEGAMAAAPEGAGPQAAAMDSAVAVAAAAATTTRATSRT